MGAGGGGRGGLKFYVTYILLKLFLLVLTMTCCVNRV